MDVFGFITGLLNAIAAIPKIGEIFERWVGYAVAWWMTRQTNVTAQMTLDAMSAQLHATNVDERVVANGMWRAAVSRKRSL